MDPAAVLQLPQLIVGKIAAHEIDVFRYDFWGIARMLNESQSRPFGMFFPEFEQESGVFQRAFSSKVKKAIVVGLAIGKQAVGRGEADVVNRWMKPGKNLRGVAGFAEDVIDKAEPSELTVGKSFLVWDQEMSFGPLFPEWRNPFEMEGGFCARCSGEKDADTANFGF